MLIEPSLRSLTVNSARENQPELSVLIAEVDQTGNMEEELDEIVQHQQDQTQAVQTGRHKDAINITCNGRRQHRDHDRVTYRLCYVKVLTSKCRRLQCGPGTGRCRPAGGEYPPECRQQKMSIFTAALVCALIKTMQKNRRKSSRKCRQGLNTSQNTHTPSWSFGNKVLGVRATSSPADK